MYSSSQSCHTAHMPHGITQCYLPPGRGDIPALTPAEAGTRLSDPGGMQGLVDLVGLLHRPSEMVHPPEDGHPSRYCVCLSQVGSSIETAQRIWLVFDTGASFDLSYTVFKEIQVSTTIGVLPSGTLLQTLDLESFATAYRSSNSSR